MGIMKKINEISEEIKEDKYKKKEKTFIVKKSSIRVEEIIDTETGVCYIFSHSGYAGGMTPRFNADGSIMTVDVNKL